MAAVKVVGRFAVEQRLHRHAEQRAKHSEGVRAGHAMHRVKGEAHVGPL